VTQAGDRLRAIAACVCDPWTLERVVDPLIADLKFEHLQAVRDGRRWRSRSIRVKAAWSLLKVVIAMDWTPAGNGPVMRTAGYSLAAIVCVTLLLALPTFLSPLALPTAYYVYVIPQLLAIAIPIGMAVGIAGALTGMSLSSKVKAGVVTLAVVGVAATFVTAGWISPAANHAAHVSRGAAPDELNNLDAWPPAELTLGQLRARIHKAADFGLSPDVGYLPWLLRLYYARWAMPAAPLTLALCMLAMAGFPAVGRKAMGISTFVLIVGYETLGMLATRWSQQSAISVPLTAWLPNLVVVLAAVAIAMLSRRSRASISV
jgi:hypothetical protein